MASNSLNTVANYGKSTFVPIGVVPDTPAQGWTKAILFNNKWTAFEKDWMDCNLTTYRQFKGKQRHDLVGWVVRQIHNLWGDTYDTTSLKDKKLEKEWKRRKKSIEDYFRNHGRQDTDVKFPYHNGKIQFHTVLRMRKSEQIGDLAREMSGGLPSGDKRWIGYYKKAEKQIKDTLEKDEIAAIMEDMKEYEAKGLPAEEQAKKADGSGGKTLDWMHTMLFKKMGMRCITLGTYYNKEGKLQYVIHDINDRHTRRGQPAVKKLQQWDAEGYKQIDVAFQKYCRKVMATERSEVSQRVDSKYPTLLPDAAVTRMPNGHIVVPDKVPQETQDYQASIIRKIVNMEYALAMQIEGRAVPWQELERTNTAFLQRKYCPSGVLLRDPEKMRKSQTQAMLDHWRERQSRGKVPLKFYGVRVNGKMEPANYEEGLEHPQRAKHFDTIKALPVAIVVPLTNNEVSDSSVESIDMSTRGPGTEAVRALGQVTHCVTDITAEQSLLGPEPGAATTQAADKKRRQATQYSSSAEVSSVADDGSSENSIVQKRIQRRSTIVLKPVIMGDDSTSSAEDVIHDLLLGEVDIVSGMAINQLESQKHILKRNNPPAALPTPAPSSPGGTPIPQDVIASTEHIAQLKSKVLSTIESGGAPSAPAPASAAAAAAAAAMTDHAFALKQLVPKEHDTAKPIKPKPKPRQRRAGDPPEDPPELRQSRRIRNLTFKLHGQPESVLKTYGSLTTSKVNESVIPSP